MKKIIVLLFGIILIVSLSGEADSDNGHASPPNVLFIMVDDRRPELGSYGASHIQSPNIDKLAAAGTMFARAYANVPVCGTSRASLLTGARPTRIRFLTYRSYAEKDYPAATTLPGHFRNHGYHTISNGKVFHHPDDSEDACHEVWWPDTPVLDYQLSNNREINQQQDIRGPAFEKADVADTAYIDGAITKKSMQDLENLAVGGQPFFLAVGFIRPQLPFNIPQRYWDLYDPQEITFSDHQFRSESIPERAYHNFGELRSYSGIPQEGRLADSLARKLIHGYYAGVSYIDTQVGLLLDKLEQLNLREQTIVVLLGDYGWNLREHGLWCKHANFETSLHAPLIIDVPGRQGVSTIDNVVEFVDIYPTLSEAAGLPDPSHLEGNSLIPLIQNTTTVWEKITVSKFHAGLTLIKDQLFYTEWRDRTGTLEVRMLFDHSTDPEETENLADDPYYARQVQQLSKSLKEERGADY